MNVSYITFGLYLLIIIYIGWRAALRTHNQTDFYLGGRQLGSWVAALSAGASDMSGWLLMGLPGFAYVAGLESAWLAIGLFIGTWLNWQFIAPRLRARSEAAGNAITLPDFFAHTFPQHAKPLRIVSALFILLFYLFYTSSGLVAAGKLFESVFGFDYYLSVSIGTLVVLAYTYLGGFLAVSWTDLFQGLLMLVALVLTAFVVVSASGGVTIMLQDIDRLNPGYLSLFTNTASGPVSLITILSLLAWGLGYFGQPHIVARFMAIRSTSLIPQARAIAVSWSGTCLFAAIVIGLSGLLLLEVPLANVDSEQVYLKILPLLFHPLFAGICLAAILAAIMSTADSQLLVASSAVTEDIYYACTSQQLDDKRQLQISRLAVVVVAVIALSLALNPDSTILDLVAYAWAGFGASFGPALLFTLYSKKTTGQAVIAGIVSGGLTVIAWKHFGSHLIAGVNEIIPGFLLASLMIILFSNNKPRGFISGSC